MNSVRMDWLVATVTKIALQITNVMKMSVANINTQNVIPMVNVLQELDLKQLCQIRLQLLNHLSEFLEEVLVRVEVVDVEEMLQFILW